MKWIKLLSSFGILFLLYLFLKYLDDQGSDNKLGALLSWSIVIWMAGGIIGLGVLVLRVFRVIKKNDSSMYIFLGTSNFLLSSVALYLAIPGKDNRGAMIPMLSGTFLLGAYILWDALTYKAAKSTSD